MIYAVMLEEFMVDDVGKHNKMNEDQTVKNFESSGDWKPRPKTKKPAIGIWILVIIVIVAMLSIYLFWNFTAADFSDNNSSQTIQKTSQITVGPYKDSDELIALKEEADILFVEQIKAILFNDPDKDNKMNDFDSKLNQVIEVTWQYYVLDGNGGWKEADNSFTDFLQNMKYEDFVPLSEDAVLYYLERLHSLGK